MTAGADVIYGGQAVLAASTPAETSTNAVANATSTPRSSTRSSPCGSGDLASRPTFVARIARLTWPVIVSQLLLNGINLADVMMLGRLGARSLAAVGYASQCLFVVQSSMVAIGTACVAMMARALGAGNEARARSALASNLLVGLGCFAAPVMALSLLHPRTLLGALAAPADVMELSLPYFRWTMAASIPVAICQLYEHGLRAVQDTKRAMLITSAITGSKLALNYVMIFGAWGQAGLGLTGAGVATVIAYAVGALLFFVVARTHPARCLHLSLSDARDATRRVRETIALSLPALAERLAMTVALMMYFRFLAGYGVATIAAYNVGVRILALTWIPGLALAVAASTLVGHALGAGDPITARRSTVYAVRMGLVIAVTLGGLFVALRTPISRLFTDDAQVIAALDPFILMLGAGLPFLVTQFTLAGALRGAGDTVTPLYAAAAGSWLIRVPLGYTFSSLLSLPLIWVWGIMVLDHLLRAIWLTWAFRRGTWDQQLGDP